MKHLTRIALVAALFASCSSESLFKKNQDLLITASASLEEKEYARCIEESTALIASTAEEADTYRLQRFFAAFLMAQAHDRASYSGAFLTEPQRKTQMSVGSAQNDSGSSTAHIVASTRAASFALDWKPSSEPSPDALTAQLPGDLAVLGVGNAELNLTLLLLSVYGRLGFETKVASIFAESPLLRDVGRCNELLAAARLDEEVHPWIHYLAFHYLRESDQPMAFRFAAEALFHDLPADAEKEMQDWITSGSDYEFVCPEGNERANPRLKQCIDGVPLSRFVVRKK